MYSENVGQIVLDRLGMEKPNKADLYEWSQIVEDLKIESPKVKIGVVGKYIELEDAYISIREALKHAGAANKVKVEIDWIKADNDFNLETLSRYDGLLIPGGFGERGITGKIETVKYAIENNIPVFGICLGLHAMSIAIAQLNGHPEANSTEFEKDCPCPVIDMMEEQKKIKNMGGTMRLGAYPCTIKEGTIAYDAYKESQVSERHRHRYEVNNEYRELLTDYGAVISGTSPDDFLVEMIELENHPWFLGCQFHPEFKSRPNSPHPIFKSFIKAAKDKKENKF